jgi:hypothetical protein
LAEAVPDAHLPDLTALLNNLAIFLAHGGTTKRRKIPPQSRRRSADDRRSL